MKNLFIKNTIILSVCMLVTKFIGAIYRIPLSNILGTEGIGIYQMVFPVYSLFLVFITGAMPTYIAQKVSIYRAKNDYASIDKLIKNALLLCIIIAVFFAMLLIIFSKSISYIQGNDKAYLGYVTVAISILFSAVTCVYRGYFQGMEKMVPNALSGILEQLVKLVIGLSLTYILKGYGLSYAVSGAFLGVLFSEVVTFIFMFIVYNKKGIKEKSYFNFQFTKDIFFQFLPLSLSSLILPLSATLDSFLVVNLLSKNFSINISTSLYGIATGMVNPFINFPILLCGTLSTAFLPALTYNIAQNKNVSNLTSGTYFFLWLFCVPCAFGIMALAPNIINMFFPAIEEAYYNVSVFYLIVSSFNIIWLSVFQISTSILNSYGFFNKPLISQIIGFSLKIIVLVILILNPNINILALCFSTAICNIASCLINLYFVKKISSFYIKLKNLSIPLIGAIFMYFILNFLNKYIFINEYFKLIILLLIGIIFYFIFCFIFKILSINLIRQLLNKNDNKSLNDNKKIVL